MSLKIIRADELDYYMKTKRAFLVDIRDRKEYAKGHIEGFINVPQDELKYFLEKRKNQEMIVLCCERGISSVHEANFYSKNGYRMGTLAGGYAAYRKIR